MFDPETILIWLQRLPLQSVQSVQFPISPRWVPAPNPINMKTKACMQGSQMLSCLTTPCAIDLPCSILNVSFCSDTSENMIKCSERLCHPCHVSDG